MPEPTAVHVHEKDVAPFVSDEPEHREFRVLLSPIKQDVSPLMALGTADVWPGQSTPCHVHDAEQEAWFVLSGHGLVVVGADMIGATPGTAVVAPPGVPHQLVNLSATEHFVCVVVFTPAGPERAFMPKEA